MAQPDIEHRIAGVDANPYLTLAIILAGIHKGITEKIHCGEPVEGNAGAALDPALPFDPLLAFQRSRESAFLRDYLGERYVKAYTSCKRNEAMAFSDQGKRDIDWYL